MRIFKEHFVLLTISALLFSAGLPLQTGASEAYRNPAVPGQDSPQYWMDRGGLYATYGNYPAAIKAYQKALDLNVRGGTVYYDLSLAYSENGEFDQALAAIDKALTMAPDNGRFWYGRGWILLRSGTSPETARVNIEKAAALGYPDALAYLRREAHVAK